MKKTWEKPQLVVLVRGKPEEGILNGCKQWEASGSSGPSDSATNCMEWTSSGCIECFSDSAS